MRAELGRPQPAHPHVVGGGRDHAAASRLFDAAPDGTAVIAGSDLIALGCCSALAEREVTCPVDVSVPGFNDIPFPDRQRPALTTVRIPHYDPGFESARLLLERIATPGAPAKRGVLPVRLIERESTAPPA